MIHEDFKNRERQEQRESNSATESYRPLFHSGMICLNCKQTVDENYELCPCCGNRLHSTHCTFCGAPMDSDELFCGECGGNIKGVQCPSCGTLSFRSFCPKCNTAIDDIGKEELIKAKNDPLYQRLCALAEKIIEAEESANFAEKEHSLPPPISALLDRYRHLQETDEIPTEKNQSGMKSIVGEDEKTVDIPNKVIKLTDTGNVNFDLSSAIEELNALLSSMVPPPGLPPQMQRNYFSARKVAVIHKSIVKERVAWICNLCGCRHKSPSDCARPELGGTWVYKETEMTTKTYE